MYRAIRLIISMAVVLSGLLILPGAAMVQADNLTSDFEALSIGNINGQGGWTKSGSFDVAVVANTYNFVSFGTQSLRFSDAVTSGSFGDQTFAKPLVDAVGETAATAGSFAEGTRQRHFEMQFDIASTQASQQPGMHLSVSPDRGDGSRMSYLRFEDGTNGLDVFFDDVQGTTNPANFVETQIATGLSRAVPHAIRLTMDTLDGPSNDVVRIFIDGTFVHAGTSWENYYRFDSEAASEQSPRIVKTALFRESGAANPANAGKGFLIDNFTAYSGPLPTLAFNPTSATLGVDGTATVAINLNSVADMYGYQFQVNYDASKVSATGAFVDSFFDTANNAYIAWNADCAHPAGVCRFAVTKQNPAAAVSGTGPLAQITFKGVTAGMVPLTFTSDILSDQDAGPIAHNAGTASLTVYGFATVNGKVNLQGRATPLDGGTVTLTDQGGNFAPIQVSFDASTGTFTAANVPVMPGGSNYQIDAAHSLYLGSRLAHVLNPTDTYNAGTTTLKGGDANNNGEVDIYDLSCIGGAFGGPPTVCGTTGSSDINHDGIVNIFDMVLAGGNYLTSAPRPW